jgi:hypothetical protein
MTITGTEERPARLEEAERLQREAVVAAPIGTDPPSPATVATEPPLTWVEVEEAEPSRARTDWTTRFAWAKTVGGW